MNWSISRLNSGDLEDLVGLASQLGYPNQPRQLLERLQFLDSLKHHLLLKVSEQQKIVGWIHLEKVYDLIEPTKIEIKAIVVDESRRSQGYGKILIDQAKKWAQEERINTIYLNCNIVRERTHEFYKREGFALTKTSHFFEIEL
jgi:GNAT superfamily N-acetyltransferase